MNYVKIVATLYENTGKVVGTDFTYTKVDVRLWAGGSDAAKCLRKTYVSIQRDGSVSEEVIASDMRANAFKESINPKSSSDPIILCWSRSGSYF